MKRNHASHSSEVFHFMVYDWKRSIKKLLDEQQVPYSIVKYFCPDSIHTDDHAANVSGGGHDEQLHLLNDLSGISEIIEPRTQSSQPRIQLAEERPHA